MIAKSDVFNLAKVLVGKFVVPAILKSTFYGIISGVVFFFAGLIVYNFGPGLLLANQHIVVRILAAILTVAIYTALGIIAGLVVGGVSALRRKLPAAQEGIHTMLAPVTSRIIERLPVGQQGIALEKFALVVDTGISSVSAESLQQRSRLLSFASVAARVLSRRLFAVCRALFVVNFIRTLQERGQTHVNVQSVEWFARERLVELVINDCRLKMFTVSKVALASSGVLIMIPILLMGLQLFV